MSDTKVRIKEEDDKSGKRKTKNNVVSDNPGSGSSSDRGHLLCEDKYVVGTADKRLPDPEGGGDIPWLLIRIRCM